MLVASNFSSTQEQLVFKLKLIILVKDLCIFLRRGGGGKGEWLESYIRCYNN